jgi:hypothetical protein
MLITPTPPNIWVPVGDREFGWCVLGRETPRKKEVEEVCPSSRRQSPQALTEAVLHHLECPGPTLRVVEFRVRVVAMEYFARPMQGS